MNANLGVPGLIRMPTWCTPANAIESLDEQQKQSTAVEGERTELFSPQTPDRTKEASKSDCGAAEKK